MKNPTEYILLSIESAGITWAAAAQVLAEHDTVKGAALLREAHARLDKERMASASRSIYVNGIRHCMGVIEALADEIRENATPAAATAPAPHPTPALADLHSIVRAATGEWMRSPADIDGYTNRLYLAIRAEVLAEQEKATATAATATPEFFQPGHTYHSMPWTFRCCAVAPDPRTGETKALGFSSRSGIWVSAGLDPDDWEQGGWTDITDTTQGDHT